MSVFFETPWMVLTGNQVENHWSKVGFEDHMVVSMSPMGMGMGVCGNEGCESPLTLTTEAKPGK